MSLKEILSSFNGGNSSEEIVNEEFARMAKCLLYGGHFRVMNSKNIYLEAFYKRLHKILDAHFDVVDLSFDCKQDADSWCYLNFLNLPNAILLPMLSKDFDCENDKEAIRVMQNLFSDKQIIPIYAKPLIKDGGALHCITWEYVPVKTN